MDCTLLSSSTFPHHLVNKRAATRSRRIRAHCDHFHIGNRMNHILVASILYVYYIVLYAYIHEHSSNEIDDIYTSSPAMIVDVREKSR